MSSAPPPSNMPPPDTGGESAPRTIAQRVGLARSEAQRYYERGLQAFAQHSYEDALADLDAAIERAPGYIELYCARGIIALEAGKLPGAKEDFEYALSVSKRQWLALYGLGTLAAGRNAWAEAVEWFTKAQVLAPARPEVWYYRAVALHNLGQTDKAAADMKTALRWFAAGDKRRSDAQKWLKFLDPNAEIAPAAPAKASKAARSERPRPAPATESKPRAVSEGTTPPKQIEANRGQPSSQERTFARLDQPLDSKDTSKTNRNK